VPFTNQTVATLYGSIQQSMPANPQVNAFLATHQTAISQLAGAYCGVLVGTPSYRDAFFGNNSGLDAAVSGGAAATSYYGSSTNITPVVNSLVTKIVGSAYPQANASMNTQLTNLLTRIGTNDQTVRPLDGTTISASAATIAACTAGLASAAAILQ